ncbi:SPOR domain-containing protein [uncultured Sphingomonas sp.]|uniref:CHAT domain-containing protein n=1 Tax=uncultured Sphingomonas sp. TaxID=158754 RepID=UPI0035CB7BF3
MRTFSHVALALSTALAGPAAAQYRTPAPIVQPQTTADQLSAVMRRVAAAPTDIHALLSAGELSIKLDDMSAAAAFFARVDKIDPRNGRAKAGMAAILVRAERPGEALRYFQLAEGLGHPASRFASDRGLALDLLGEQERAQRDYRLALRGAPDDETMRRYALSLGISGRQALALEQLEPLTRRQDRAAWRVRAFVLAMNGDVAGASRIAVTMMPRGMAGGLQPFFERLPTLPAADRAFAVHFGEVRPTPARLADARMKPGLAPLGPDPFPAVRVAGARPAAPPVVLASRGGSGRGRSRGERRVAGPMERRGVVAAAPRAVVPVAPGIVASVAPRVTAPIRPDFDIMPRAVGGAIPSRSMTLTAGTPVQAAASPATAPSIPSSYSLPGAIVAPSGGASVRLADAPPFAVPAPIQAAGAGSFPISPSPVLETSSAGMIAPPVTTSSVLSIAANSSASARDPAAGTGMNGSAEVALAPAVGTAPSATDATSPGFASLAPAPVTAVRSEDSILARIVASITIPGAELGVVQPERRGPSAVTAIEPATARVLAAGAAKAASQAADRAAAARTIATASKRPAARPDLVARKGHIAATEVDKPRAAAERRAVGRAKAAEVNTAAVKAAPAKADGEPGRIWVQVAGGASENDLPRAWNAAQKKAAALKGRAAFVTPLRATNRVVTGPFKTDAEARAFVNQLSRQGVSAFQFTSATGQKMTKLSAK